MVVAAKAEEAVEPELVAIDEDERVSDGVEVYLVEVFDVVVDCELEGVVEAVCEDGVAVIVEDDLVVDFVREPVE